MAFAGFKIADHHAADRPPVLRVIGHIAPARRPGKIAEILIVIALGLFQKRRGHGLQVEGPKLTAFVVIEQARAVRCRMKAPNMGLIAFRELLGRPASISGKAPDLAKFILVQDDIDPRAFRADHGAARPCRRRNCKVHAPTLAGPGHGDLAARGDGNGFAFRAHTDTGEIIKGVREPALAGLFPVGNQRDRGLGLRSRSEVVGIKIRPPLIDNDPLVHFWCAQLPALERGVPAHIRAVKCHGPDIVVSTLIAQEDDPLLPDHRMANGRAEIRRQADGFLRPRQVGPPELGHAPAPIDLHIVAKPIETGPGKEQGPAIGTESGVIGTFKWQGLHGKAHRIHRAQNDRIGADPAGGGVKHFSIRGPSPHLRATFKGETTGRTAHGRHHINLGAAIISRVEGDLAAIGRKGRRGLKLRMRGQAHGLPAPARAPQIPLAREDQCLAAQGRSAIVAQLTG